MATSSTEHAFAEWLIVMRPDGVVEAVSGGASVTWLGHRLEEIGGLAEPIREAAVHLLTRPAGSGYLRRAKVFTGSAVVELLLVEAMPIRRAHVRIDELVTRTMDVFVAQARSGDIELTVEREASVPPTLYIDGEKVSWALATLVGNAMRYLHYDAHPRERGRVAVRVSWVAAPPELVITVEDNGPGMAERKARWLFQRDPSTSKTAGLALVLVSDVVVAHRGSVHVESHAGKGTTFTIRLPRVQP